MPISNNRKTGPPTEKNDQLIAALKKSGMSAPWSDEFEKMISGLRYHSANSPEMQEHKLKTKKLCKEFSKDEFPNGATLESVKPIRMAILKQILGKMGRNISFEVPFHANYGCNISVGDDVFANHGLSIYDNGLVTIGSRVLFGPKVSIYTDSHSTSIAARRSGLLFARPVTIGDDCWICANAVIVAGVTIGNGCTVTAGSVVTHDIPPFSIARGNPAEVVGKVENPDAASLLSLSPLKKVTNCEHGGVDQRYGSPQAL